MTSEQYQDFVAFMREKEDIGIVEMMHANPPHSGNGEPCIVFWMLGGYYKQLILPKIQRIQPFKVRLDQDMGVETSSALLRDCAEVRVRVYF